MIQTLIDRGHAYEAEGEVLFDTASMADYGQLSKRNLDEQQAGARVAVDAHKKNPRRFRAVEGVVGRRTRLGRQLPLPAARQAIRGRPGWHIECSAMSAAYLGEVFDIHGGGLDLIFPHHENEIAQSRCAHGTRRHGQLSGCTTASCRSKASKMSKSDGNFVTIHELLETEKFGGRKWPGEVLRLAMLMTHYREPIDFSVRRLEEAANDARRLGTSGMRLERRQRDPVERSSSSALRDDLQLLTAIAAACTHWPGSQAKAQLGMRRLSDAEASLRDLR